MGFGVYLSACVKGAWRGSISLANSWGSLVGAAVIAGAAYVTGSTYSLPNGWLGVFEGLLICMAVSWVVIFLGRVLVWAPYRISATLWNEVNDFRDRLEALEKEIAPVLKVVFDEEMPYFIRQVGAGGPPREIACVSVQNASSKNLTQCKVRVLYNSVGRRHTYLGLKHSWVTSHPPFSLVPGDAKAVPILWIIEPQYIEDPNNESHVSLFSFVEEDGKWREGGGIPILVPGNYEMMVEVLSADAPRGVRLSLTIRHEGGEWVIRKVTAFSAGEFRWPVPDRQPMRRPTERR